MWIVSLLFILIFGWFSVSSESTVVERPAVAPAAVSMTESFDLSGDPVETLGVEPVSGEARYAFTAMETWVALESGEWQPAGPTPGHDTVVVDSRDSTILWAGSGMECYRGGGGQGPLVQSTDGGASWIEAGPEGLVPLASWMDNGFAIAHDCSGLQISTDSGQTWAVPEGYPLGSQVTAFTVASTPGSAEGLGLLVGVTGEGGTSQLYRVSVSGFEPPVVSEPLQTYYAIGSVGVLDDGGILLGAPQGVMRSDDRGETWTTFRGGLESTTLEQDPIEFFPPDLELGSFGLHSMITPGEEVYISGVDGIYRWSESAFSWVLVVPMESEVHTLAVEPATGALLAQTADAEVLRSPVE